MTSETAPQKNEDRERFTQSDLATYAAERFDLFPSTDGILFATPRDPRAAKVAVPLTALRPTLSSALFRERGIALGRETLSAAITTLEGEALQSPVRPVYLRAAEVGKSIHIDLADSSGRFVEVSPYGWEVRDPIAENDPTATRATFRRSSASKPLPTPEPGGSRDDLRQLLGLDAEDPRWLLAWGWLVGTVFESIPRPILWALGPQGSGKSTRARMILSMIEPTDALGREPGRSERDDTTNALGRFIPSWDNIGNVSARTSDWICRLTTGVSLGDRALYTQEGLFAPTLRRTGVATSIVLPFGLGPDALERLILLEFERVAEEDRRPERDLWEDFERLRPRILGALLDDVAGVLRHLPTVRETRRPLPRMADYAQVLYALDVHADLDDDEGFAAAYIGNVTGSLADRAEADPLTAALLAHVRSHKGTWQGPASRLLAAIDHYRPDDPRAAWPRGAASLGGALRRGQETLRAAGLILTEGKSNGARYVRLELVRRDDEETDDEAA